MSSLPLKTVTAIAGLAVTLCSCTPGEDGAQRYRALQAAYEGRIAQLEEANTQLDALLVLSNKRFENQLRQTAPRRHKHR